MNSTTRLTALGLGAAMAFASGAAPAAPLAAATPAPSPKETSPGEATVLKWKDGKTAVFLLEFDDSCETHVKNAIPELRRLGMVGTFYVNPGNGPFQNQRSAWEKEIPLTGMEYGNHTFKHKGAPSLEVVDEDMALCNAAILSYFPDRKQPRLISFGRPGGVPWTISPEENAALLKKYNLVERPSFSGYPFHAKTKDDVLKLVDNAIAKGEMGHHDFHGVGGDWHSTPMDIFLALLDKLDACKDAVWVTDPVSYHKYLTERKGAELQVVQNAANRITLRLTCNTDPALYDLPLTLRTKVPADWKACSVTQGQSKTNVEVADGAIQYTAAPVTGEIVILPVAP